MSEAVKILIMPQTRSIHVRLHVSILYLSKVIMHLIDREQPRSQHLLAFFPTVYSAEEEPSSALYGRKKPRSAGIGRIIGRKKAKRH